MVYVFVKYVEFNNLDVNIFLKDYKNRTNFQNFEIQQKVLKSLVFNSDLSTFTRRKLL
jgi:transposase-like protein